MKWIFKKLRSTRSRLPSSLLAKRNECSSFQLLCITNIFENVQDQDVRVRNFFLKLEKKKQFKLLKF